METIKIINHTPHVHVGSRKYFSPDQMVFLESDINYTLIHLTDGRKVLSSTTLSKIEKRLSVFKNFLRINRQSIVNQNLMMPDSDFKYTLPDNRKISFSRRKAKKYILDKVQVS